MSGLFALLDDVAALVKLSAASLDDIAAGAGRASVKAAGVVVDDAAVTPRYVQGLKPERELSIIWRIAKGSLRNKLLIILPVALILSQFAPFLLTPILMVGGTYLCYEGAEKLWEKIAGHGAEPDEQDAAAAQDPEGHEKRVVASAIRTDFILSAEIMVIALNEVASEGIVARAIILAIVAVLITALVYGAVGLIVKMDDAGLALSRRSGKLVPSFGRGLVKAMPIVLATLSWVGMVAMLWVGGHILLVGMDELGLHAPYGVVHHLEEAVHDATGGLGAVLGWITNTFFSAVFGAVVGAVAVTILHFLPFGKKGHAAGADHAAGRGDHGEPTTASVGPGSSRVGASAATSPATGPDHPAGGGRSAADTVGIGPDGRASDSGPRTSPAGPDPTAGAASDTVPPQRAEPVRRPDGGRAGI